MSEQIELVVTVKAYPALSQKYGEVVCVAGVRTDTPSPEWVRLFPVGFRDMPFARRFKKYQAISLEAYRHDGDTRPETYRPNMDTIKPIGDVLPTKKGWAARWPLVEPLIVDSMCGIQRRQAIDGTSLGAFRPIEVTDLTVDDDVNDWSDEQAAIAMQTTLFGPAKDGLEQIPLRFRYHYRCSDESCRGHAQSMIDWEINESYRSWRSRYDETVLLEKIKEKFLAKMCADDRDTVFFVGNMHQHPGSFLVLGVFWPPAAPSEVNDGHAR